MSAPDLQFLKLGGSLITDKHQPHTARDEVLARLAAEIALARQQNPSMQLVIGHGSGSFGHVPAQRYGTRQGAETGEQWRGFVEVWREANALNRLVIDALGVAGLPALAISPMSSITARKGRLDEWMIAPLAAALQHGLIPVIQGDTVFDHEQGATILSTEDLFVHLAKVLQPRRILLAGIEPGVWADYPTCSQIIDTIAPGDWPKIAAGLSGSAASDVTGGMRSKVAEMLAVVESQPGLEVLIFCGERPDLTRQALIGHQHGTLMRV